jgi:enterochelin esterase-like enzyme
LDEAQPHDPLDPLDPSEPPPGAAPAPIVLSTERLFAADEAEPSWRPGALHRLGPFAVPGLSPRRARVYLPSTFGREVPRFVLLLFDGQNVFEDAPSFAGGWHVHDAVERLARGRRLAPIVVGVDHGGEHRLSELSPFPVAGQPGHAGLLLDWLAGGLLPRLRAELPLVDGPIGAVAGGSSMGGLAAVHAHFRRPDVFGGALAMSPSFWVADDEIVRWIAGQPTPEVSRIYLDCGVREGKGTVLAQVAALAADLTARGYDPDHLMFRPDPRGAHNERSWRRRLPKALRFFYR